MTAYKQTRCELDHPERGVCLRRLNWDGSCPGEDEHCPEDSEHPHGDDRHVS